MREEHFDVAVIGGGPGGASAATILARAGKRVVLFERSRFPRFQIGESLLPAGWDLWRRLGVTEKIEAEGFTVKQGTTFGMFNEKPDVVLLTAEYPDYFERPYTYHVERARFDEILLDHAAECGVEVRQEWSVQDVLFEGERAVGVLAGPNGETPAPIHAQVVVDASGRACHIARKLGWLRPHPELNKIAHYSHFTGAFRRDPHDVVSVGEVIEDSVTTDIHTIEGGWLWYIPLKNGITSVGAVLDARFAKTLGAAPQERFDRAVQSCDCVREWMKDARQAMELKTVSSIAYMNDCFHGAGFVLVGDASMFIDPVFSAGVTLALRGGVYAADAILDGFAHGNDFSAARLGAYEDRIREPMERIFKMIYNWYRILDQKDANNIILRARQMPMLRERFIVLLSGGYDKVSMAQILAAAEEPASTYLTA
ncbi:NAD(P)/FAD-dependent oxidoreductase [Methylococcus sp. EFPC2]|uniref:NAD(P)/FAD-dependent oxidoreductase n=1 Tax=Methylococcus sp. EFPC2 TaxID=2812648 RepID=UPI0019673603|nr:NAD(P)/FAD-dependent oxidoreductase [Methylococcus sp. EFPC2]QSA96320.1 tryptophan 7-halogenase [Methylococcus sp. EFPC2]